MLLNLFGDYYYHHRLVDIGLLPRFVTDSATLLSNEMATILLLEVVIIN